MMSRENHKFFCLLPVLLICAAMPMLAIWGAEPPEVKAGQTWEATSPWAGTTSSLFMEKLVDRLKADDKVGLDKMIDDGQMGAVPKGDQVKIVKVTPVSQFERTAYAELTITTGKLKGHALHVPLIFIQTQGKQR